MKSKSDLCCQSVHGVIVSLLDEHSEEESSTCVVQRGVEAQHLRASGVRQPAALEAGPAHRAQGRLGVAGQRWQRGAGGGGRGDRK